jgi:uncharacterized membrane protein
LQRLGGQNLHVCWIFSHGHETVKIGLAAWQALDLIEFLELDELMEAIVRARTSAKEVRSSGRGFSGMMFLVHLNKLGTDAARKRNKSMQASVFIAQLLGPMFVVAGVAFLVKPQMIRTILPEFIRSPTWLYLAGFLGLLVGMALVLTHRVWALDWRLIITVIGWLTLVRALITIFQPQWIVAAGNAMLAHRGIFVGSAVTELIIGLVLSYFGYAS